MTDMTAIVALLVLAMLGLAVLAAALVGLAAMANETLAIMDGDRND